MQFYTGNFLDGRRGKGGTRLRAAQRVLPRDAALPDSPNQPKFPSTILRPGGTYRSKTVFAFKLSAGRS